MSGGKEVLDYWTEERIGSAQAIDSQLGDIYLAAAGPQQTPIVMSSEDIVAYWTPERLQAAKPVDATLNIPSPRDQDAQLAAGVQGVLKVTEVPDTQLTTFPYQCVGKLFFVINSQDSWTSAFHIASGDNLLTAAHAVVTPWGNASQLLFIPAMSDKTDITGKNYGVFPATAYWPDPKFNPNDRKAEHDICTVNLGPRSDGKTISQLLPGIQVLNNQQYTSQTAWNTIGYPANNPNGKMSEISGNFVSLVSNTVQKNGAAPHGMSGGPWILDGSGNKANGLQAGNVTDTVAISPYFRDPWKFDELDALLRKM